MMSFNNQDREYPVGAQFIGAPPMYRPMARRCPPQADKSAPTGIRGICLKPIIAPLQITRMDAHPAHL
jgi:hypothetical protein